MLLATAVAAAAMAVTGGTVEPGHGAASIELGMSRAEVVDALGKPREQNPRFMAYGPKRSADATFDLYLEGIEGRPVRMIGLWGAGFELADGTKLFARKGVVAKLKRRYGKRLRKVYDEEVDSRVYRLKGRHRGRKVWTDFTVDRFGRDARVLSIFIFYPGWTG